jgi:UDP-glucose 4-epimerase
MVLLSLISLKLEFTIKKINNIITIIISKRSIVILRYFNPAGAHESGLIGENPKGNVIIIIMK